MRIQRDPRCVSYAPHNRSGKLKVIGWEDASTLSSIARSQHDMAKQCTCLPKAPVAAT